MNIIYIHIYIYILYILYIKPQTISTLFLLTERCSHVVLSGPNLQFQAEEHSEKDKTETEEADGQADQPSEHSPFPGRVVELLTACYGTAALYTLQRQQRQEIHMIGNLYVLKTSANAFLMFSLLCGSLFWKTFLYFTFLPTSKLLCFHNFLYALL